MKSIMSAKALELVACAPPSPEVPVPPEWGGYAVRPTLVEFWQGRRDRLHDRLAYRRDEDADGWVVERLAP